MNYQTKVLIIVSHVVVGCVGFGVGQWDFSRGLIEYMKYDMEKTCEKLKPDSNIVWCGNLYVPEKECRK